MKNCWHCLLILFLMPSCNQTQEEQVCYHVVTNNYAETMTVNGSIQSVNSIFLKAPQMFLSTVIWIEENGKFVQKGDTVCILEHPETNSRLESISDGLEQTKAQLNRIKADHQVKLAMLQADIENNNILLSINSLDSIQKRFAPPLQQKLLSLEKQKADILKQKLDKKYTAQKTIGETEIRGLTSRIKQMENHVQRMQGDLDQLIITAPKDGLLLREEAPEIYFSTGTGFGSIGGKIMEGSSTWTNMNILQIPDLDEVEVLAELTENNYKKAKEGQKVLIRVEAKNNLLTSGVIKRKMLTGKQVSRDSNVKMYEALIEVDSCHRQLTPGMNAECEIMINEFKDTLVVPAVSVFEEGEEKFVYVQEGKKFRKTLIESGYLNTTYSAVVSGLSSDTYIAFAKPSKGKIIKEKNRIPKPESEHMDSLEQEVQVPDTLK